MDWPPDQRVGANSYHRPKPNGTHHITREPPAPAAHTTRAAAVKPHSIEVPERGERPEQTERAAVRRRRHHRGYSLAPYPSSEGQMQNKPINHRPLHSVFVRRFLRQLNAKGPDPHQLRCNLGSTSCGRRREVEMPIWDESAPSTVRPTATVSVLRKTNTTCEGNCGVGGGKEDQMNRQLSE